MTDQEIRVALRRGAEPPAGFAERARARCQGVLRKHAADQADGPRVRLRTVALATVGLAAVAGLSARLVTLHGRTPTGSAALGTPSSGAATPTAVEPGAKPRDASPPYVRLNMSQPVHLSPHCDGPAGYEVHAAIAGARGAAIVTVDAIGAARWNTPDGRRPTQAYVDALFNHPAKVDGVWPPAPWIYTAVTLTMHQPLHGSVPAHPVTAYLNAGTVGQDMTRGCLPFSALKPTQDYVVLFGAELTTGQAGNAPIVQPVIDDALAYDPSSGEAETPGGPQPVTP